MIEYWSRSFMLIDLLVKMQMHVTNHSQSQHPSRTITSNMFHILKKCSGKFDCLLYEMFLIHEHKPCLNVQSDSIKAKLFTSPLGTKNLNLNINILIICWILCFDLMMVSWGHRNVVLNMILPVIFIIKSITLSCLIGMIIDLLKNMTQKTYGEKTPELGSQWAFSRDGVEGRGTLFK